MNSKNIDDVMGLYEFYRHRNRLCDECKLYQIIRLAPFKLVNHTHQNIVECQSSLICVNRTVLKYFKWITEWKDNTVDNEKCRGLKSFVMNVNKWESSNP